MAVADAPEVGVASTAAPSLVRMTEKALEEMPHWRWHTVMDAVKQCHGQCGISSIAFSVIRIRLGAAVDVTPTTGASAAAMSRNSAAHRSTHALAAVTASPRPPSV
jgi:hypothetical protein